MKARAGVKTSLHCLRTNSFHNRLTSVKSVILVIGILVSLILAGCGGGGGSSSGGTGLSVTYRTNWASSTGSQVVTLESGARAIIGTRVLNQSAGQTETVFTDLSAGAYRVIARHHAGNDGNGALLGELETPLNVTGNLTTNTATTGTASEVRVEPSSLSLTVGGHEYFQLMPGQAPERRSLPLQADSVGRQSGRRLRSPIRVWQPGFSSVKARST